MTAQCDHNHDLETANAQLLEAFAEFYNDVAKAFGQEPEYSRTPFNERERYSAALTAVAGYFGKLGEQGISQRFFELGSAIADLNIGTVHPLLRPERVDNRRGDRSQLWRARARVVLAFDAFVRSGLSRDAAVAAVRSKLPNIAALFGAKARASSLQTVVLGWRKQLLAKRVKNFEAQELLSAGLEKSSALPKHDKRLVEFAEDQAAEVDRFLSVLSPHS
jgi:hypothetical protein